MYIMKFTTGVYSLEIIKLQIKIFTKFKKVKSSLNIYVVDINQNSLNIAKDRWDEIEQYRHHTCLFFKRLPKTKYF